MYKRNSYLSMINLKIKTEGLEQYNGDEIDQMAIYYMYIS